MSQLEGMPIANIVLGEIIDEVTKTTYTFDTADKANAKPDLSKGKEDILRVKNRLIALNRTEDICIGYNIKLTNNTFSPETMAIVDGGVVTTDGYEGAEVGKATERHPFTLNLYSEEKDYDSETLQYVQFTFKHNKGKPVEFKFEDGKFFVPELESNSRPKKGEKPVYIKFVKELPTGGADPITPPPSGSGDMKVDGGTVTDSNTDVGVSIGSNVKWTFIKAISQDGVTSANFTVKEKSNNTVVAGNVTIDDTKKIVTFIPASIEKGVIYIAEAKAVNLLDSSGTTTAILVEFTTI